MYAGDYTNLIKIFEKVVNTDRGFLIAAQADYASYICRLELTADFYEKIAYAACGSRTSLDFATTISALQVALDHTLMVVLNRNTDTVSFATFTHSGNIVGDVISGFTKEASGLDLVLANRAQYLSETFLTMGLTDFYQHIETGAIVINELPETLESKAWLKNEGTLARMQNLIELNGVAERYLDNRCLELIMERPRLRMVRFDGMTGELKVNS
jgi:hypothetical protein